MERQRDQQRHALRARQAQRLGHQFADDYVQAAEQRERRRQCQSMSDQCRISTRHNGQDMFKKPGHARFAERANRQARQRDSQLYARNHLPQVAQQNFHYPRAQVALGHQLLYARHPHRHQRKLRRGEKTVQQDERQDTQHAHCKHGLRIPCRIVAAHKSHALERCLGISCLLHSIGNKVFKDTIA